MLLTHSNTCIPTFPSLHFKTMKTTDSASLDKTVLTTFIVKRTGYKQNKTKQTKEIGVVFLIRYLADNFLRKYTILIEHYYLLFEPGEIGIVAFKRRQPSSDSKRRQNSSSAVHSKYALVLNYI
jgi:hypothetical protein